MGKGDTIILDKLAHACLIGAARLSGATVRTFLHNDMNRLENLLAKISPAKRESLWLPNRSSRWTVTPLPCVG